MSSWEGTSTMTPKQKGLHVLNRLGFGPRPGDLEAIQKMGILAYIEKQLAPDGITDSEVDRRLGELDTLQLSRAEMIREYPPPGISRRLRMRARDGVMDMRDDMPASSDSERRRQMRMERRKERIPLYELSSARLIRAVHSRRQLQEVMVDFWMNHFSVFAMKGPNRALLTDFEQNVIRPRALGRFEDLLMATAKSPAMPIYLDNWISSTPRDKMRSSFRSLARQRGKRMRRGEVRDRVLQSPALARSKGLNENYARELLELHTVSIAAEYSQQDVIELAKSLTGWTLNGPSQGFRFHFEPLMHEEGKRRILGKVFSSKGMAKGEEILQFLAHHPSTARFVASKLVRRFVSDEPPRELARAAADAFVRSRGDIPAVLLAIFTSPTFFSPTHYRSKIKKPLELIASSLRAVGADLRPNRFLLHALAQMSEPLYLRRQPDGYPDNAESWINSNALLSRLNFSLALATDHIPGVSHNGSEARTLLAQLDLVDPDALGRGVPRTLTSAYMLGSPEFQKR